VPIETRRRIDLCTCGQPREAAVHGMRVSYETNPNPNLHPFHPNPQPPPLPVAVPFHRVSAVRNLGAWIAEVYAPGKIGRGQAATWLAAVNAAIEDLKEKEDKS
jgi:hypothetical protein